MKRFLAFIAAMSLALLLLVSCDGGGNSGDGTQGGGGLPVGDDPAVSDPVWD